MNGCLFVIIAVLFLLNFYNKTLFFGPTSLHVWRQADCLSLTKNYYEEGMHFFSPKIHCLIVPGGRAVSEFPILNYTVAALWKIFGEKEFIYKLLEYFIYLLAIFVLFNTLIRFYSLKLPVFFMITLLLTSPLLVYYSFNFLSDVPALSFCIIAFSLLFSFYKTSLMRYFYLSLLTGTLAVLLKASALLSLALLTFFALIDIFDLNRFFKTKKLLKQKVLPTVLICVSFFLVYAWYRFARNYTSYSSGIFLLTISPVWEMAQGEIFSNFRSLFNNLFPVFLNRPMLVLFFGCQLYIIFYFKKLGFFLKTCFVFSLLFFIAYILVFFQVFSVHDYYLVSLFISPVISFFCFLEIQSINSRVFSSYAGVLLGVIFGLNAFFSAATYRMKLIKKDNMLGWYPFISVDEIRGYEYMLWSFNKELKPIKDLKPKLRELGVKREDIVLSLTDGGPNVALYLMDQKGYVLIRERVVNDSLCLKKLLKNNVRYIVLNDASLKEQKSFKAVAGQFESIYVKPPVEVFKLK